MGKKGIFWYGSNHCKAAGFLLIIALGFVLKSVGLFRSEDSRVLANLVLKITLPMSIIHNFATLTLSKTHLVPIGLGFLTNFAVIGLVLLLTRKMAGAKRAFFLINCAGYNLGLCVLPYLQSFFDAEAVAIICMFDVSNAMMCFGVTFSIAMTVAKGRGQMDKKEFFRTLLSSMPFMTYLLMIVMAALHLRFPEPVYTVAGMIGQANAFLAMFLIGLLFELKIKRSEVRDMVSVISVRLLSGIAFALIIYFCLPLPLLYRQVLALVVFGPILSVAPVYTERCGYNRSVAAVLNSFMLPFSLLIITILMMVMHI